MRLSQSLLVSRVDKYPATSLAELRTRWQHDEVLHVGLSVLMVFSRAPASRLIISLRDGLRQQHLATISPLAELPSGLLEARMILGRFAPQMRLLGRNVDRRRAERCVAECLPNDFKRGAAREHLRGDRVAKRVG